MSFLQYSSLFDDASSRLSANHCQYKYLTLEFFIFFCLDTKFNIDLRPSNKGMGKGGMSSLLHPKNCISNTNNAFLYLEPSADGIGRKQHVVFGPVRRGSALL